MKNKKYKKKSKIKKVNTINKISLDKSSKMIQKNWKLYRNFKTDTCLRLIKNLNDKKNNNIMSECYFNIFKISKLFPPGKNENKFIYGKLIESELIKCFNKFTVCEDLDKNHKLGSEYKNDCTIYGKKFSIKASKNGGNITIINKLNKINHKIDINFIICHITNRKLYIFPSLIIDKNYIKDDTTNIHFKSSIFRYLETKYPQFIYKFPILTIDNNILLDNTREINIYEYLYNTFVKCNSVQELKLVVAEPDVTELDAERVNAINESNQPSDVQLISPSLTQEMQVEGFNSVQETKSPITELDSERANSMKESPSDISIPVSIQPSAEDTQIKRFNPLNFSYWIQSFIGSY